MIVLDELAIGEFMRDPHGPVALTVLKRAEEIVVQGAHIRVPVRTGRLYDSIEGELGEDAESLYARVSAEWYDVFLEKPAKQVRRARRTLRNALRSIPKLL